MPTFVFTAKDPACRIVKGRRIQASEGALARNLAAEGLLLLRARLAPPARKARIRLTPRDLTTFLVHLATYQEAGLSIMDALQGYREPGKPALEAAVADLGNRISGGAWLSEAMAAHPGLFKPIHVSMVQAGEAMGRMDQALRAVIKLVEWDGAFRAQVRKACTYPIILLCLLALIGGLVTMVSIPPILELLKSFHIPLPLVTEVFLVLGTGLIAYGWLLLIVPTGIFIGLHGALRHPPFRLAWDTALLKSPLLGPLLTRMALARFAHFFGAQYRAGIPLVSALRESEGVLQNARLCQCIQAMRDGIERGEKLAVMAEKVGYFPHLAIRMLAIGEETGSLEETLERTARHFDEEATTAVQRFFEALNPIIMVFVAAVLVFVAAAVLLPIYSFIGGINA